MICETIRKTPDDHVKEWFQTIPSSQLYVSVLSFGEIRRGIEKLADQPRKLFMTSWLENDLALWFGDQIIPVCLEVADKWGHITAKGSFPAVDTILSATALAHNMKLVTRNVADFNIPGLEIINPWDFCSEAKLK